MVKEAVNHSSLVRVGSDGLADEPWMRMPVMSGSWKELFEEFRLELDIQLGSADVPD